MSLILVILYVFKFLQNFQFYFQRLNQLLLVHKPRNIFLLCYVARLRDIRQVPDQVRRPLSTMLPSNTESSVTTDSESSGTPTTSRGKTCIGH